MKNILLFILGLLILPFALASPYCPYGQIGFLNITEFTISDPIVVDGQGIGLDASLFAFDNGVGLQVDDIVNFTIIDTTVNQVIYEEGHLLSHDPSEPHNIRPTISHSPFSLQFPPGSNEYNNFTTVIKVFHGFPNQTVNQTTSCDDESKEVDIQLYREVTIDNIQINPNFLECGNTTFNVSVTVRNKGYAINDVNITVKDDRFPTPGLLDLEAKAPLFNLGVNETKIFNFSLKIPPLHLYNHPLYAAVFSENMNFGDNPFLNGWVHQDGPVIIGIAKCSTDNAENLQSKVLDLEKRLKIIETILQKLIEKIRCLVTGTGLTC